MLSDSASLRRRLAAAIAIVVGATIAVTITGGTARAAMGTRNARSTPVTVSPAPNTPDASPLTQISILGPSPSQIRSVAVTGSSSGRHAGHLRAYSANRGASFILDHPLDQGERAAVQIRVNHHAPIAYHFTVAQLAATPPVLNIPVTQPAKLDSFVSQPLLLAPKIEVLRRSRHLNDDIFLTPLPSPVVHPESDNQISVSPVGPGGPMIINSRGQLVWFDQLAAPDVATNLRLQQYRGQRVLTWWQGAVTTAAFGEGEGVIANGDYRTLRTVRTGNGYPTDLHEFTITRSGGALLTAYSPVLVHLPGTAAGQVSPLLDSIVQEVDIRTGLVMWEWHAYGHIPLKDSYATTANSSDLDAYHINSIQALSGNRLLISARDTSALYMINGATGRIEWTLGGKASNFRLGRGARFYFQHDAQLLPGNRISLFDDEGGPPFYAPVSRGLILSLNRKRHTATVQHQYHSRNGALADSEGSLQLLPGGNVFAGYGSEQYFSEFTRSGRLTFNASLPDGDGSYREYVFPWRATPKTQPTIVVHRTSPDKVAVYASWNGATTVARWQVLAGANASALTKRATHHSTGFETQITLTSSATKFAVRALNQHGRALATSRPVPAS